MIAEIIKYIISELGNISFLLVLGVFCCISLFYTIFYSVDRLKSCLTSLAHIIIFFMGWWLGEWIGLFLISIPIVSGFYLFLYYLAQVIFPVANPELVSEKCNKFRAFFWYVWGMQYPHWVAKSSATRHSDDRIKGNHIKRSGKPGIVWTHSHQVAARSIGIEFLKVGKSGFFFTERSERPVAIVDLRTQLRPMPFTALTKDGIEINAFIFISFQIDRTDWNRELKHEFLRMNPVLQNGTVVKKSPYIGYPYSGARVHAALSVSSIDFWDNDSTAEEKHWDEIVVQRVLKVARLALSERKFDELWAPVEGDNRGMGAIDEVSSEIGKIAKPELKKMGVELFGSRIVNYIIDEDTSLYKRLKKSWLFAWDKKIARMKFEGETKAEALRIEARMSTRRVFMETVSETLLQTQDIDNKLLKQLTTLNFITTLEKLLEDMDEEENPEKLTDRISAWGRFISRSSRDRGGS